MIRDNDGSTRFGIAYLYPYDIGRNPTGIGGQPSGVRTTPIGHQDPITDSADGAAGTPAPYATPSGQSAVGGPVPWQSGPSQTPPATTTPFYQIWHRPDVWDPFKTPTGTVTPATAPTAEAEPLKPRLPEADPVQHGGPVDVLDVHDPRESSAPTVSLASDEDIGELGRGRAWR